MTKEQKASFLDSLLSAFPTRSSLMRMLEFKLDWRLDEITAGGGLQDTMYELLRHAEKEGKLRELLQAAYDGNPENPKLKEFYAAFFAAPAAPQPSAQAQIKQETGATGLQGTGSAGLHATGSAAHPPLKLVYCHASRDTSFGTALERHLTGLVKAGLIEPPWSESQIPAGADTKATIHRHWGKADLIVLLVSADFLSECDDYVQLAEQRHTQGATVIPVITRSALWTTSWFGRLTAYPVDQTKVKPITRWSEQDDAWVSVLEGIQSAIEALHTGAGTRALV